MQEGVLFLTDIDEGSLEARFQILDATFKDGADFTGFARALDFKLFEDAVLEKGDPFFERLRVDDQLGVRLLLGLNRFNDALDERLLFFTLSGVVFKRSGIDALGLLLLGR